MGGEGNNRTSHIVLLLGRNEVMQVKLGIHSKPSQLRGAIFIQKTVEECRRKTAIFSGILSLKIVVDIYLNLVSTLDVRNAVECLLTSGSQSWIIEDPATPSVLGIKEEKWVEMDYSFGENVSCSYLKRMFC